MLPHVSAARRISCLLVALVAMAAALTSVAQTPPAKPHKHGRSIPGTPLDTLMHSHITTTVPPAQDFVRESRPDPKVLDYTPLTGSAAADPDRPKPRDPANVEALQAELEHDGAVNARKARGLAPRRVVRHARSGE